MALFRPHGTSAHGLCRSGGFPVQSGLIQCQRRSYALFRTFNPTVKRNLAASAGASSVQICSMSRPGYPISVDLMRDLFRAFEDYVDEDQSALPEHIHKIIHSPPADAEGLRQWINKICELCAIKPSQLSREANLSPSTINRFLKSNDNRSSLNAKTIVAIENAAAILAIKIVENRSYDWNSNLENDEPNFDHPTKSIFAYGLTKVPIMGMIALNGETVVDDFKKRIRKEYSIVIPSPGRYTGSYLFAFEVLDFRESKIDREEKEFVVCVPTWFSGVHLKGTERVIIVSRPRGETISAGIREISIDGRGNIWLMPLDSDVGLIEPSFLGRETVPLVKDGTGVALVVVGSYRSFEWAE